MPVEIRPMEISVVVAADSARSPHDVVGSLDAQTLASDRFELMLLDRGLTDAARASLERLAERRTNVRVLPADADWLDEVSGAYVLLAGHDQLYFPDALSRLVAYAETHSLDLVAGRPVQLGQPLVATFLSDDPDLIGEACDSALASPVRLVRRDRARRLGDALDVAPDARVGVLASYPAAYLPTRSVEPALVVYVDRPSLSWQGSDVRIEAMGTVASEEGEALQPVLLLRQLGTFLTYVLPSEGSVDPRTAGAQVSRWQVTATFSPLTAAEGPLPPGQWQVDVVLSGAQRASAPVRLPGASLPVGLLDDLVLVTTDGPRDTLHLDVGATRSAVVTDAVAARATVTESAAGSLLQVQLPEVHVQTSKPLAGHIALDRFRMPATLETASGTAQLSAFVSGLAGAYPISAQVGSSPLRPTGLTLEISGAGEMRVVPTPPPRKAPPAKPNRADAVNSARRTGPARKRTQPAKKAAKKTAAKKTGATKTGAKRKGAAPKPTAHGPVAQLRRAVAKSLEPQIRKLRKQPLARALYRRATGLTGSRPGGTSSR